jgi:3-dehydroquinate synthase
MSGVGGEGGTSPVSERGGLRRVRVELGPRSYDVVIGPGLLAALGARVRGCVGAGSRRVLLAIDHNLPAATVDAAAWSLQAAGFAVTRCTLAATEQEKSLAAIEPLLSMLLASRHERGDPVVALGGGIVGDVAGFAAAMYRRGVPVVQCPTTLLSMVDASVGGKTGVNLRAGNTADANKNVPNKGDLKKNMVGAFHQPVLVVADVRTLASLPERERRAGLAECVKHGLLAGEFDDAGLFEWIASAAGRVAALDDATLTELVARNVAIKARVVAGDEREEASDAVGGRALLNLGHTFGHAIETLPGIAPRGESPPLTHGEAVALGVTAACGVSVRRGWMSDAERGEVLRALNSLGLPTTVAGLPASGAIVARMRDDKKVVADRLRLVLPVSGRRCRVVDDTTVEMIEAAIDELRE